MAFAPAVQDLIDALGRLPGVGPKSAQRIAFHLLKSDPEESNRLARAIVAAKERIGFCEVCFNLSEGIQFLTARFGGRIDTDLCARLHDVTGGWPLG